MKQYKVMILVGIVLLTLALIFAACSPKPPVSVLEIVSKNGSMLLTMDDLKALPVSEGYAGIKSSTGKITPPTIYRGVSLKDLIDKYGGMTEGEGLNVIASDGYGITFSYAQTMNGTYIAYDPATGDELKTSVPLTAILAYERDGQALDQNEDGILRISVISASPNQVVDGHWAVKWVNKIEFKDLGQEWILEVDGPLPSTIDRASFQSCSASQCHGISWKDEKAQDWTGVPLWLLVGYLDDDIKHEGPAFNDTLAEDGYQVDITANDGYSLTLDSVRIKRNDNIMVAYTVNGNPLPDSYFPLRLVGSDLQKSEMVGMIASISISLDPTPQATTPTVTGFLNLTGLVDQEQVWNEADLRKLEIITITAEHPKKGSGDYEGIRLNDLLDMAGVKPGATKLLITASDGFSTEVVLTDIYSCTDCLLGIDGSGKFIMVMPGLPSNTWVQDVVKLEIK